MDLIFTREKFDFFFFRTDWKKRQDPEKAGFPEDAEGAEGP